MLTAIRITSAFAPFSRIAEGSLEIRLVSTLTPEDEARYARVFLKVMTAVLDGVPVAYALSAELTNGEVVRLSARDAILPESPSFL